MLRNDNDPGCSGVTDYRIILNNDYYIAKTSANNTKIF